MGVKPWIRQGTVWIGHWGQCKGWGYVWLSSRGHLRVRIFPKVCEVCALIERPIWCFYEQAFFSFKHNSSVLVGLTAAHG